MNAKNSREPPNRGGANNVETPGSEHMPTSAGPWQQQNANNSISAKKTATSGISTTEGTPTMAERDVNDSRKPHNSMNAKSRRDAYHSSRDANKSRTSTTAGTPEINGCQQP